MPRIDFPHRDTNETTESSTTTASKSSSNDTANQRDQHPHHYVYGSRLSRIPDTSDDLERNWLTATASPRFSRAGLPHVIMPIRADSKAKDPSTSTTGNTTNANVPEATGSRHRATPDSKVKGKYVAAKAGSSTPAVPGENDRQNAFQRRHTTGDRGKRPTTSPNEAEENRDPFTNSAAGGCTRLHRVLSLGSDSRGRPTSFTKWRTRNELDSKDDTPGMEPGIGDDEQSGKKRQWSSLFKSFLRGTANKGLKVT